MLTEKKNIAVIFYVQTKPAENEKNNTVFIERVQQ